MITKKTNSLFIALLSLLCIMTFSFCAGAADSTEQTEGIFTYTVENDQATLTKIDYKGLDEIHIPETLGGYEVTKISNKVMADETGTFGDDTVTTVYVPKTVTYISSSAFELADLGYIVVDEDNPNYSNDDNGVLFDKDKTRLIKAAGCFSGGTYTVPDGVETIGSCAFMHCLFVKEIILPDSVNTLGFEAFFDAQSLESVNVPEGVTKISQMCFAACPSLKYISLPSTLTTIFNSAFTECYSIEKIVIPEGVTELGVYAFENDTALEYVYLPSTLTTIESGALGNCTKITDICYGGSQEDWEKITINTEAYYGDRPVIVDTANIRFNINPDPYKTIDFENQNGIMSVYGSGEIPTYDENGWHYWDQNKDDVTTLIVDGISSIGSNSFCDFPSLTNVIVVSDSLTFEPNAFVNCPKLENVIIFGN
ncbi:MAG: leucine-rich repeat protein, partial [Acutalibacteraceae bacterium]